MLNSSPPSSKTTHTRQRSCSGCQGEEKGRLKNLSSKNLFRYKKVSYRGLAKNAARLFTQFALVNLVLAKRALLDKRTQGIGAS